MSAESDLAAGLSPEELIPGDVASIDSMADNCSVFADELADTRKGIQYIELNGADWVGGAADVYLAAKDSHIFTLEKATDAFDAASTALSAYATAVREARATAAGAVSDYKKAKKAADQSSPPPTSTAPLRPPPSPFFSSIPAPTTHDAAVKLIEARHHVELAGKKAAKALEDATAWAPAKLSRPDGGGGPSVKDIVTAPWHFGHGLFESWTNSLLGLPYAATPQVEGYADKVNEGLSESSPALVTLLSTLLMFAGPRGHSSPEGLPEPKFTTFSKAYADKELERLANEKGLTLDEVLAMKSGAGPVLKGRAGELATAKAAEDNGLTVLGHQVHMHVDVDGKEVNIVADMVVKDRDGTLSIPDAKNGPHAGPTKNQALAWPAIRDHGFTPYGKQAELAGLTPGKHYPAAQVWAVYPDR